MTTDLIQITGIQSVGFTISPDSILQKQELLHCASLVSAVSNGQEQTTAVATLRSIKTALKTAEESRQTVKAPVLELGRKIDGMAASYMFELEVESKRISKLLSAYQAEQIRIAQEAERKRQEELAKAEAERQRILAEEKRKAEEAEKQRQEELKKAQAQSRLKAALLVREQEEQRAAEAKEAAQRAAAQIAQVAPVTVAAPPPRAAGMMVRKVWKFEVVDAQALYDVRPEFCVLHVIPTAINTALRNGMRECPGLRIWEETQAGVRL